MQAEIVMIGSELLLGQIEDTNATYMSRVLAENGINLYQKTTVGDNIERIVAVLNDALDRSDIVLCSGGLGPTEDDLTREAVAEACQRPLEYHEEIWEHIETLFMRFRMPITENNKKQAMVPKGASAIDNPNGTAPGLLVEDDRGVIVCMPGVPRELKYMLEHVVVPYIRDKFDMRGVIHYRVLKVCGLGESRVDDAIGDLMSSLSNPTVGVLANLANVRIRITAKADSLEEANKMIDKVDAQIRERLPNLVMGVDEDTLEGVINDLLAERDWTLTVAETTTGGMISQRLVAEGVTRFMGGSVQALQIADPDSIGKAALDLARHNMLQYSATCGLAVVSDPTAGATVAVFVTPEGEVEWQFGRAGTDERMQARTTVVALEYVRRHLNETRLGPD